MVRLTKVQVGKLDLAELTQKSSGLFAQGMQELIPILNLEPVDFKEWDIQEIWNDVKESVGYMEVEGTGKIGRGLKTFEWGNPEAHMAAEILTKKYLPESSELYPIDLTSHLLKWYSIFKPAVIDLPCYEPSEEDYGYYFMLRGNGTKVEKLEELIGGGFLFYAFIHRLYTQQGQRKRTQIIRQMLSDSDIVNQLRANTYVVPARLQFLLTTPQVYNAYGKALIEGKSLPLPAPREEAAKNGERGRAKRHKELLPVFKQVIEAQKEGTEVVFTRK